MPVLWGLSPSHGVLLLSEGGCGIDGLGAGSVLAIEFRGSDYKNSNTSISMSY